jgi:hypothetical protein
MKETKETVNKIRENAFLFAILITVGIIILIPSLIIMLGPIFGVTDEMMRDSEHASWLYWPWLPRITTLLGLGIMGFAVYIRMKQVRSQYRKNDKIPKVGELPLELQNEIYKNRLNIDHIESQNEDVGYTHIIPAKMPDTPPNRDNW